jgi:aminotransferase in exopolysaccharide biosynthesis
MFNKVVDYIREVYSTNEFIPLHAPRFIGNEKKYLEDCIDTTFVSSVGKYVDNFENIIAKYTGAKRAIVIVNGTEALHLSLLLAGVKSGDEVITQPLTFIATANAISYTGANPIFIDVDIDTIGLSPNKMEYFLLENGEIRDDGFTYNKKSGKKIAACVPMHTFGHPVKLKELISVCKKYNIALIEDAAESLGSKYDGKSTGAFGEIGVLSFNGNKIITTGGGGMILTNNDKIGIQAKHLSTQAKIPHQWEFKHDSIGYNYRMPNINAALGCAQMENLELFIKKKRKLANQYAVFFKDIGMKFFKEPKDCCSNYWLNAIICEDLKEREQFLKYTNENKVMTRPIWCLMTELPMFKDSQKGELSTSYWLADRVVNIPSSVII